MKSIAVTQNVFLGQSPINRFYSRNFLFLKISAIALYFQQAVQKKSEGTLHCKLIMYNRSKHKILAIHFTVYIQIKGNLEYKVTTIHNGIILIKKSLIICPDKILSYNFIAQMYL